MLTTPLKAFLLAAASVAALATAAYVSGALDRFIQAPSQTVAALPEPATPADPKGDRPQQPSEPTADAPAADRMSDGTTAQNPSAAEIVPPSFDLVRVEAGGSLVVAGNAAPGSQIELLTGSKVIGSAVAGSEGDFAVVLDEPLEPGAYQIVLRATDAGGVVAMSPETAVVSVPEQKSGQVLALVEKPGEPSKLLTVPEPGTPSDKAGSNAPAAEAPSAPEAQAGAGEQPAPTGTSADVAAAGTGTDGQAPADAAAAPSGQAETSTAMAQPQTPSEQQVASPQAQEPAASSASAAPSTAAKVKVEAVEIEGNQVFVAGVAEPGALVRVYANDIFLGETRTAPGGQFLVEAMRELAVGDYIIRADVVAADGSTVIVRATVPFQREPGESISAVAAPPAAPTTSTPPAAVAEAPAGEAASASAGTVGAAPTQDGAAANTAAPSGAADASGQVASAEAPATNPNAAQEPSGSATEQNSGGQTAAAASSGASGAAEPPSVAGDSLQAVDGSVIIRRGDSLWRISRRVYGRGIRYSTIYLANQDQIADPDRIWPGQVFRVPEKTDEGEAADMGAISDRQQLPQTAKGDSSTTTR